MKHYQRKNNSYNESIFESNGPCGKIRGTIQQILDKYESIIHENNNTQDEIKWQNILQYVEHYTRLNNGKKEKLFKKNVLQNDKIMPSNSNDPKNNDIEIATEIFGNNVNLDSNAESINNKTAKPKKYKKSSEETIAINAIPYIHQNITSAINKLDDKD